jgi:cytochrome oxidase Cu insertion factor (SCO1/SenC/PrrC family)
MSRTRHGLAFRLHDDVMKGKALLINFIYTDCDATCR